MVERGVDIEVVHVVYGKLGVFARYDDVDYQFDEFERVSFVEGVAGVADAVANDCDASAVGILSLMEDLAKIFGVGNLLVSIQWDFVVVGNEGSFSARDAFL